MLGVPSLVEEAIHLLWSALHHSSGCFIEGLDRREESLITRDCSCLDDAGDRRLANHFRSAAVLDLKDALPELIASVRSRR